MSYKKVLPIVFLVLVLASSMLACRLSVGVGDQLTAKHTVRLMSIVSSEPNFVCTVPEGAKVDVVEVDDVYIGSGEPRAIVVRVDYSGCSRTGWGYFSNFK